MESLATSSDSGENGIPGMAALRAFRVLRALKAISAIPGLIFSIVLNWLSLNFKASKMLSLTIDSNYKVEKFTLFRFDKISQHFQRLNL